MGHKNILRAFSVAKELEKWGKNNNQKSRYCIFSEYIVSLGYTKGKKINGNITTCLVVPDLPEHMNLASNVGLLYKIAKRIDSILINRLIRYVDSFVLLTEPMAEALGISEETYCVVEGMVNKNDMPSSVQNIADKHRIKSILYTGTLNYKYGIGILLEAFESIDDSSYELWICGYGEAEGHIKKLAEVDKRIKWFGAVSREQALSLQQIATVLINPRPPGEEFPNIHFHPKT